MNPNYRNINLWQRRGDGFLLEVSHSINSENQNLWTMYVYIYPLHRLFTEINNEGSLWKDDILSSIPFHGGVSYHRFFRDRNGNITAKKLGCDYDHLYDDEYRRADIASGLTSILRDADQVFEFLSDHNHE